MAGLAAACALAGCATWPGIGPGVRPAVAEVPVPAVAAWQQPASAPQADAAPAPAAWWARWNDALLDQLVAEALRGAPDLRSAQARLREARARRDATDASRAPDLSVGTSVSRSRSSGAVGTGRSSNLFDLGFDASWEADLFGRLQAGVDAADADALASAAGLQDARLSVVAEVARLYASVRSLQARQAVAMAAQARQADTLQIARWRAQAGLVATLDVVQAEASVAQTDAQQAALAGGLASARLQLEALLGREPGALSTALDAARATGAADLPRLPTDGAWSLPADVLRQRPDVRQAEAQWRAEVARTAQAHAAQFPSLKLSGSIGWQALTLGSLGQGGMAALAAAVSAPLFDGGQLRAQLAAQVAVQDRYAIAYEQAMRAALTEVEDALANLASGRRQADALARAATASHQAADLARLRYRSGLIDFRAVLDAERSALSADDSLVSARTAVLGSWIQLHKALGVGGLDAAAPPPPSATARSVAPDARPASGVRP